MEDIVEALANLNIMNVNNDNNDNNMEQQRNFVMQNLKLVHPFDGRSDRLGLYVSSVESILPNIARMAVDDRVLFFNCILRTLDGAALDVVRRERPEDWASLKELLINEFGEHCSISQLILNMNKIKFKGNVKRLYEEVNNLVCRINDAISLSNESIERKTFFKSEVDFNSLTVLKKELPIHLVALLNANLVDSFKGAMKVIRDADEIEEDSAQTHFKSNNHQKYFRNNVRPQVIGNEYRNIITPNRNQIGQFSRNNSFNDFNTRNFATSIPNNSQNLNHGGIYRTHNNYGNNNNFANNRPFNNNNSTFFNNQNNNANFHPTKRARQNDSLQSRIRRYGPATPMQVENFHCMASINSPPS